MKLQALGIGLAKNVIHLVGLDPNGQVVICKRCSRHAQFFRELGRRIREFREQAGYSEGDMSAFGFSTRH